MNCQIQFSRKYKKNIISLSSAEFGHSMASVRTIPVLLHQNAKLTQAPDGFGFFCCFYFPQTESTDIFIFP